MPVVLPENAVRMPVAVCPGCQAQAELATPEQRADPDGAVACAPGSGCCELDHPHTDCRPLIIYAFAHVTGEAGQ